MKLLILTFVVMATVASAQIYQLPYFQQTGFPLYVDDENHRHRRDVGITHDMGASGKVFGKVGGDESGLFGKAGYERNIFNDGRGKLDGQVFGTRVLSPNGDSSHFGGGLNWQNSNSAASLDLSRQIHGPTTLNAAGGGRWAFGKNTDLSAQGVYSQTFGRRPDVGFQGLFTHRW